MTKNMNPMARNDDQERAHRLEILACRGLRANVRSGLAANDPEPSFTNGGFGESSFADAGCASSP
jgi:hypothetical protein